MNEKNFFVIESFIFFGLLIIINKLSFNLEIKEIISFIRENNLTVTIPGVFVFLYYYIYEVVIAILSLLISALVPLFYILKLNKLSKNISQIKEELEDYMRLFNKKELLEGVYIRKLLLYTGLVWIWVYVVYNLSIFNIVASVILSVFIISSIFEENMKENILRNIMR